MLPTHERTQQEGEEAVVNEETQKNNIILHGTVEAIELSNDRVEPGCSNELNGTQPV